MIDKKIEKDKDKDKVLKLGNRLEIFLIFRLWNLLGFDYIYTCFYLLFFY
jgi:hypothetical protein